MPTHEFVFGGPVRKDRLWFFSAGRFQNQQVARNTIQPVNLAYVAEDQRKRFEVKLTGSLNSNHRLEGAYSKEALTQLNNTFSTGSPGMGFYLQNATGKNGDYGFTSFTASDGGLPPPTNLRVVP